MSQHPPHYLCFVGPNALATISITWDTDHQFFSWYRLVFLQHPPSLWQSSSSWRKPGNSSSSYLWRAYCSPPARPLFSSFKLLTPWPSWSSPKWSYQVTLTLVSKRTIWPLASFATTFPSLTSQQIAKL